MKHNWDLILKLISELPTVKFNTNSRMNSSKQSEKSRGDDDKQNPVEDKDTQANIERPSKSSSNSSVTESNETNVRQGKNSKDKRDATKDSDSSDKSPRSDENRSSVRFDVKPMPDEHGFGEEAVGIRQSASGSAVQSPASQMVDSPSFMSVDETRKRRSKSRGSGGVEKTATSDIKKESARNRSKSKTEGGKKKTDSSPDSGYAFKRREDIEKEAKKKKKEEEERKKKEEEEAKKKKKEEERKKKEEEEERRKKEEKEAKKEKSEKRKSRRSLVPSLSIKGKDKDLNDSGTKTLTSRDSKDDLHIRSKSSVAEERGGIKSKKSMPSLKIKSISPRGERKGSNPPVKDSKTSLESSSNKPSPITIPAREVEPKSEPAKTDRPLNRSLHRSASTENIDKRTAKNMPEPPPIPTPDGAGTFRVRKRSLSTNELKGDGTDAALTSTEPISIGKMANENKQREDTYVNILKKSIRDILVGTNMKIEREELTKVSWPLDSRGPH